MFGHWFVVGSQKTVKVYTEVAERNRLKLLKEFDNPLGRERNKTMIRHKVGMGMRSTGRLGSVRYAESQRSDPHEEAAVQFAKEISGFLDSEMRKKSFETLTVVAEPSFLGKLRASMKPKMAGAVTKWVRKDLLKTPIMQLQKTLLPPRA